MSNEEFANCLVLEPNAVKNNFYQLFKPRFGHTGTVGIPSVSYNNLSPKQKQICDLVQRHIYKPLEEQYSSPMRLLIIGQAGTGKSQLLMHLKTLLEIKKDEDNSFQFKSASFTGLSAHNIGGETIHSCFRVPLFKLTEQWTEHLQKTVNAKTRQMFANVHMIILDEFQMISKNLFAYIDAFLRRCDPSRAQFPFAKRSIILAGDIFQFQPVASVSIFWPCFPGRQSAREFQITNIFRTEFRSVFMLDTCFRQESGSDYYDFLCRLKRGQCTPSDVEKLKTRLKKNLTDDEINHKFKDSLSVYPTRFLANMHNWKVLDDSFDPDEIVEIENGDASLRIVKGAKIMVTRNLTVAGGVYNGAVATVADIVYEKGSQRVIDYIVANVKGYDGNVIVKTDKGWGVPIFRMPESELCEIGKTKYKQCKYFPILLFYASTAHKSIGLSLPKISIFLDTEEMCPALDFVTFSRVRDFKDLMILDADIDEARLTRLTVKQLNFLRIVNREEMRLKELEENMGRQ